MIAVLVVLAVGCSKGPTEPIERYDPFRQSGTGEILDSPDPELMKMSIAARVKIRRQLVEFVEPDGRTVVASFHANVIVFSGGRASGSAMIFTSDGVSMYRMQGGTVVCSNGSDGLQLIGSVRDDADESNQDARVIINVQPANDPDNPECIIWDITDSCSGEAEGRLDIVASACGR
jgi:hypothetical protein